MGNTKVFDKVKWHYPDGENCPSLAGAKLHIEVLMDWLKRNDLLSEYGKEIYELGVDNETSVTSEMVSELGNMILNDCYEEWVKRLNYGQKPSTTLLNEHLQKLRKS